MSQQVLARKWRPTRFSDLIGQDHVRKALSHALDTDRLHHAYLFTGTRGVGKTTVARILARCLNCETGVTATPCGTCHACAAIDAGRFVDLIEVDAASRTKVDDTRELLENVSYAPNQGRYKVYLIDEVHMLSPHSFNALLKTLEEPPAHVIFLLATTDPQKVLPTVLSRCLQFHLRDLAPDLVASHLATVLHGEQIAYDEDALWHLAKAGRGSVRDALTLLDQAIAFGEGEVRSNDVIVMLGQQGQSDIPALLGHIARGDAPATLRHVDALAQMSPDWLSCLSAVQSCLHHVAITHVEPAAIAHLPPTSRDHITALADAMHPEFVQLAYQFALQGYRDLPLTPDPRTGFEMVLLRMLAFRPARAREFPSAAKPSTLEDSSNEEHHRPIDTQQSSIGPLDIRSSGADSSIASRTKAQSSLAQQRPSDEHPNTEDPPWVSDPEPEPQYIPEIEPLLDQLIDSSNDGDPTAKASQLADVAATQDVFGVEVGDDVDRDDSSNDQQFPPKIEVTPSNWSEVFDQLNLHGMTGGFASQMALLTQQNLCWSFVTTPDILRLITEVHRHRIETSLRQVTQLALQVEITASDTTPETPLQRRDRLHAERLALAKSAFVADPVVKTLVARFNAAIDQDSIQPVSKEI